MPNWLSILITVVAIYILISIVLYYVQDYFLFKPEKLPKDFQFFYENQNEFEFLPTEKLSNNRRVEAGASLKDKVILVYQLWVTRGEQYVNSHVIKVDNDAGLNASKLGVVLDSVNGENITFKIAS